MQNKINTIKKEYYRIAKTLGAPKKFIQFAQKPRHDGSPHIEYEGNEFHFVVTERGSEFERRKTTNSDDILFWLVSSLTWQMAAEFELHNRIESEDFRIQLFSKDLELLNSVNPKWAIRIKEKYNKLLPDYFKFER